MFRWCPSTFRYIDGPLKPLPQTFRKRIPRIDLLSQQNDEAKVISAFTAAVSAGVPVSDALERARPRIDPATLDECCVNTAISTAKTASEQQEAVKSFANMFKLGKRLDLLARAAQMPRVNMQASNLEVLRLPVPGYTSDDYAELYDSMSAEERKTFDENLAEFNAKRESHLERPISLGPESSKLRDRWATALKFYPVNGFDYLAQIKTEIPTVVATLLVTVAGQMLTAGHPQSLTSLCRKIGFALEGELLNYVALKHNVKAAYARSHYLWGILGARRWTGKDHIVVGSVYLQQALHKCTIDQVDPAHPETTVPRPAFWRTFYVEGKTKRGIIKLNPALNHILDSANPNMPMLIPPARWRTFRDGGYIFPRGQTFLPVAASQAVEQRVHIDHALKTDAMARNLDGVDALAATAWVVNKPVLEVVQTLFKAHSSLSDLPGPLPETDAIAQKGKRLEQLQHEKALEVAQALGQHGQKFYLPLHQDFRGRVYPMTGTKFSFMGSDSMRALFKFWHSRPLGPDGLNALRIHLANVYGAGSGKSFADRIEWAKSQTANILASAETPLENEWWQQAAKPFMALAACFEINAALKLDDPGKFLSRLPVVQDGSCNGLQHYAALARCSKSALAVNMTPSSTPHDVYTHVAVAASEKSGRVLDRSVAKKAVIGAMFGSGSIGVVRGIGSALRHDGAVNTDAREDASTLGPPAMAALASEVPAASKVQEWLRDCGRRILAARRADVPAGINSLKWTSPLGFPIVQNYGRSELMAVRTPLQAFYLQSPFHPAIADSTKHLRAFPANFIHSMDASHLLMTANAMREAGHDIAAVHDGFWTHAGLAKDLARLLRTQAVELYQNNWLENVKKQWEEMYTGYMVLVNLHASSSAYDAVQNWRRTKLGADQAGTGATRRPRSKPHVDLDAELYEEYAKLIAGATGAPSANSASDIVLAAGEIVEWPATGLPRIGVPHTDKTQVWLPLEFSSPPEGDYDVKQILNAEYFFN